jgi:hypothetical protein
VTLCSLRCPRPRRPPPSSRQRPALAACSSSRPSRSPSRRSAAVARAATTTSAIATRRAAVRTTSPGEPTSPTRSAGHRRPRRRRCRRSGGPTTRRRSSSTSCRATTSCTPSTRASLAERPTAASARSTARPRARPVDGGRSSGLRLGVLRLGPAVQGERERRSLLGADALQTPKLQPAARHGLHLGRARLVGRAALHLEPRLRPRDDLDEGLRRLHHGHARQRRRADGRRRRQALLLRRVGAHPLRDRPGDQAAQAHAQLRRLRQRRRLGLRALQGPLLHVHVDRLLALAHHRIRSEDQPRNHPRRGHRLRGRGRGAVDPRAAARLERRPVGGLPTAPPP